MYDAIEKKYLKTLSLIVAKQSDGTGSSQVAEFDDLVLENYSFRFDYAKEGECLMATGEHGDALPCTKENSKFCY